MIRMILAAILAISLPQTGKAWEFLADGNVLILEHSGRAFIRTGVQQEGQMGAVLFRYACQRGSSNEPSRTNMQVTFQSPDIPKVTFDELNVENMLFSIENPESRLSKNFGPTSAPFGDAERGISVKVTDRPAEDFVSLSSFVTTTAMLDTEFFRSFLILHGINADLNMSYAAGAGDFMMFNLHSAIPERTILYAVVDANGSTRAVTEFWNECSKGSYIAPLPNNDVNNN